MISSKIRNLLLVGSALGVLAACSTTDSTTDTTDTTDTTGGGSAVTTGTTDGENSSNGIKFADGTMIMLSDLHGGLNDPKTLTLRAARLNETDNDDGDDVTAELVDLNITSFQNDNVNEDEWIITVEIGDDTMLISYEEGSGDPCGIASNGVVYCTEFFEKISYNVALLVLTGDGLLPDGIDSSYVVAFAGLETDPDILAGKGLAMYMGDFIAGGFGQVDGEIVDGGLTGGDITIAADFASAELEGGLEAGSTEIAFAGVIEGNGWTATDTETSLEDFQDFETTFEGGDYVKSDGSIQLDGVFYGSTGQETAGTIIVDIELTDDLVTPTETFDVTGVGGFHACELGESCYP